MEAHISLHGWLSTQHCGISSANDGLVQGYSISSANDSLVQDYSISSANDG